MKKLLENPTNISMDMYREREREREEREREREREVVTESTLSHTMPHLLFSQKILHNHPLSPYYAVIFHYALLPQISAVNKCIHHN